MLIEDTGNFCLLCNIIIDTEDMFEPACNCISEIEEWENLPSHIRSYFKPPKGEPS